MTKDIDTQIDELLLKLSSEQFDADYDGDDEKREDSFLHAKQSIKALIADAERRAVIQAVLNINAEFKVERAKVALSSTPKPPARHYTPEEHLVLISTPYLELTNQKEGE